MKNRAKNRVEKFGLGGTPTDPTKPASKATASDILAANQLAKDLARRKNMQNWENVNVGNTLPVVEFNGKTIPYGTPIWNDVKLPTTPSYATDAFSVPETGEAYYYNKDGDPVRMNPNDINLPQFRKGNKGTVGNTGQLKQFGTGGEADEQDNAWMGYAGQGLDLMKNVIGMLDGISPNAYSKQPMVNANTVRGVVSPYNKFGEGGVAIEAEGNEVIETPDGELGEIQGPSHEEGGVQMTVPDGTKIYSDRVAIDGKTMQERKKSRERAMNRLKKLADKNPSDSLLKATIKRTEATHQAEEQQDMAVQQALHEASNPKFAVGGVAGDPLTDNIKNGLHTYIDPRYAAYMNEQLGIGGNTFIPLKEGEFPITEKISSVAPTSHTTIGDAALPQNIPAMNKFDFSGKVGNFVPTEDTDTEGVGLTTGDYVGMAGGLFNAVAPIFNTINARKNTAPNINRFLGYGKDAIDANDASQDYIAENLAETGREIDLTNNTQIARNRNSASSVNTARALDTITTMGTQKAKSAAQAQANASMAGIMDRRGAISMDIDRTVMTGEAQRDMTDKMDTDNYYSNMADNLVNFGTNVQGIGKAFNTAKSNKVDANLISQLSKYGLSFDENGNLISKK